MLNSASAADGVNGCHGDDDATYSFNTVHNLDLYGCELAPTLREGMRAWNMTVQYWLATYVYKRLHVKTSSLRFCVLGLLLDLTSCHSSVAVVCGYRQANSVML